MFNHAMAASIARKLGLPADAASDILAHARAKTYRTHFESNAAYNWKVGYNYALDLVKTREREPLAADMTAAEGTTVIERASCESHEAQVMNRVDVEQLIAQLSASDQEFVRLRYWAGLKPEEIAGKLRISVNAVYLRQFHILARLRAIQNPLTDFQNGSVIRMRSKL